MAAATVTTYLENHEPTSEVVLLEASNAETYKSRKFSTIQAASATINQDHTATAETVNVTFSSGTATIHLAGGDTTDVPVTLTLYGTR